ncbi:MAG: HIT domain-containing protein [archaeon]
MDGTDCAFCGMAEKPKRWAGATSEFYMLFDRFPVNPGHLLLIPKRHVVRLEELRDSERTDLFEAICESPKIIVATDLKKLYEGYLLTASEALQGRPDKIKSSLWYCRQVLAQLARGVTRSEDRNHFVNDGRLAGRTVDHFHWHVVPRYEGDVLNPAGGGRSLIPGRQFY